jgi:hypothetical protein
MSEKWCILGNASGHVWTTMAGLLLIVMVSNMKCPIFRMFCKPQLVVLFGRLWKLCGT